MRNLISLIPILYLILALSEPSSAIKTYKSSQKHASGDNLQSDTALFRRIIKVEPFMLEVVPPSSGVRFFKEGIIFLSLIRNEAPIPGHISFGNAETYFALLNDSVTGVHELFSSLLPFPYPSDAVTFNSEYDIMYFTGYSKAEKSEKIYRADFSPQKEGPPTWTTDAKPLEFCSSKSVYTHPALSNDGQIMIFASNMEGSTGGLDLFITRRVNEKWSVPENTGEGINSQSNELYPTLDKENNLYFSSDRNPGRGYDIYICEFNGKTWEKPVLLDKVINSENDDIAFTLNREDEKTAFFTTKEKTGKRKMQLHKVTIDTYINEGDQYTLSKLFTVLANPGKAINDQTSDQLTVPVQKPPVKEIVKTEVTVIKKRPEPEREIIPAELIKEAKTGEKQAVTPKVTEEISITSEEKKIKTLPESSGQKASTTPKAGSQLKEGLVYRIQVFANMKPKGSYQIKFEGKTYDTFEYFHNGGYRTCIGEFSDVKSATEFQNTLRKSGYPQAFVIALINNERSLDPALFR